MKYSGQLFHRTWLYLSQENIWLTASSFPPSQTVYQLFDLNEILYGPKWLSGKDIWTDVKVWTLQCFFFFGLSCDSSTWFNKKETSVFKKIFPLLKKNCIPSSHWLQAVVQICGGQCSFKTIPKKWTWWGATYSLSLIIVWYTVLLQYL